MRQAEVIAADIRSRFASFIREVINPGAEERDRNSETFSRELIRQSQQAGLWSLAMPKACGGGGLDSFEWGVALEQIGYLCEDGSFPLVISIRTAIAGAIHGAGRPELNDRYVLPMARAERFGSFAYSDGADPFAFKSHVTVSPTECVAVGEKLLVTGGASADVFMTYLREPATGDLVVVLIERDDPGVEVTPVQVTGLRAAGLATLKLNEVHLAPERIVCRVDGVTYAQRFLNDRRLLLACGPLGRMQAIFEMCIDSLGTTVRYGAPLLEMQNVQASIGRMYAGIEGARAITYRALARQAGYEPGYDPLFDPLVTTAKYVISERAIEVATRAFRLLGGKGYVRDLRIERYLRDFYGLLAGGGAQDVLEVDLGVRAVSEYQRRPGSAPQTSKGRAG